METIVILRYLHIIGATVLLGTGAGIAFFMLMAHRTGDPRVIAHVAATVVIADAIFTAAAVIAQPVTGVLLANAMGWKLTEGWIVTSIGLYIVTGLFWLPVVWIQMQMRRLAEEAILSGQPLSPTYYRLFRIWFACGIPAFTAVMTIVWLMVRRPHFSLW
jgi:uncharacterized membrane protein